MEPKELLATLRYCQSQSAKGCGGCPGEAECGNSGDFLEKESAKVIERLLAERDAAVKCAQRFSYFNERKCRWCRFGVLEEGKEWGCSHPKKETFYGSFCTKFEYVYREENA